MPSIGLAGLILGAYLAAGRIGAVATCLISGVAPWNTLICVALIDFLQIPVYGLILETMKISERISHWVEARWEKVKGRVAHHAYLSRFARYKPLTVMLVSSLPLRGFGVLSACVLAHMLKQSRLSGTLCVLSGSVLSTTLLILLFYFPIRWFSAM
ncbi:MAG: small multi-drug export protein [Desulfobacterales bacterium]|jgi:uncharacterized membrane protein|nr:small multi-drug export protein [Desulfobacterales bacterium]